MPTPAARRHHDELFGDRTSTLARTDPELVEYFDNFAFDDVQADAPLEVRTRVLVQLAALVALGALGEFRELAGGALRVGVTPVELKEVVYQAVPYVGMGRVRDVLQATNELLVERGVDLPLPGRSSTTPQDRAEKGRAVQEQIVGPETVAALYENAPDDTLHVQRYLSANCFGDHYTRGGLDVPTRELLTLSMLVALGGADPRWPGTSPPTCASGTTARR